MHGKRTRRATIGASIALLVASFGWAQPVVAAGASDPVPLVAPPVVVTIGFDDGTVDQFDALPALNHHHMHATFFINSGFIGDPDHLSVEQLGALAAAGNEIGGHTVDHANIQPLSTAEATAEVCDDRATLMGWGITWGFTVTSFAYPFGSYDANSEAIVKPCGYDSARTVSGVSIHVGKNKIGETLPPVDRLRDTHAAEPEEGDEAFDDGAVRPQRRGRRRRRARASGSSSCSIGTATRTAAPTRCNPRSSRRCWTSWRQSGSLIG